MIFFLTIPIFYLQNKISNTIFLSCYARDQHFSLLFTFFTNSLRQSVFSKRLSEISTKIFLLARKFKNEKKTLIQNVNLLEKLCDNFYEDIFYIFDMEFFLIHRNYICVSKQIQFIQINYRNYHLYRKLVSKM